MKKSISTIISIILLLILTACGANSSGGTDTMTVRDYVLKYFYRYEDYINNEITIEELELNVKNYCDSISAIEGETSKEYGLLDNICVAIEHEDKLSLIDNTIDLAEYFWNDDIDNLSCYPNGGNLSGSWQIDFCKRLLEIKDILGEGDLSDTVTRKFDTLEELIAQYAAKIIEQKHTEIIELFHPSMSNKYSLNNLDKTSEYKSYFESYSIEKIEDIDSVELKIALSEKYGKSYFTEIKTVDIMIWDKYGGGQQFSMITVDCPEGWYFLCSDYHDIVEKLFNIDY